jgi:hypothetical protein
MVTDAVSQCPGVRAAVTAMRECMAQKKCSYDKAYFTLRSELRRLKTGDGGSPAWDSLKNNYDIAYQILGKEATK